MHRKHKKRLGILAALHFIILYHYTLCNTQVNLDQVSADSVNWLCHSLVNSGDGVTVEWPVITTNHALAGALLHPGIIVPYPGISRSGFR